MKISLRKISLILSILLIALLALSACTSGGEQAPQEEAPAATATTPAESTEEAPAATATEPAESTEAETPEAQSDTEETGEEASAEMPTVEGTIQIGTNAEYQPFEFVDESGEIVGFDIDLMNALAATAGLDVEYVNTKWDGIFVALANGEFDAVISAVTITDERAQVVDFTEPYFNAGQAIAVRQENDTITGPEDLVEGVTVGVQLGTTGDIYVSDNTDAEVARFEEAPLAIQALANGDVDAVVVDAPTLADFLRANAELNLKIVGEPFTDEYYGIAVNKERTDLLEALNIALDRVKSDGTYDQIYNKWFGTEQ